MASGFPPKPRAFSRSTLRYAAPGHTKEGEERSSWLHAQTTKYALYRTRHAHDPLLVLTSITFQARKACLRADTVLRGVPVHKGLPRMLLPPPPLPLLLDSLKTLGMEKRGGLPASGEAWRTAGSRKKSQDRKHNGDRKSVV